MTVIRNLATNAAVQFETKASQTGRSDSFSRMLNEVDRRERSGAENRTHRSNEQNRPNGANSSLNANQSAGTRPSEETRASNEDVRARENGPAEADQSADRSEQTLLSAEAVDELVEEVACALQIEASELLAAMLNLEIQPVELVEAKNVTLLIAEVLEVESPAQLLGVEGVKEMFADVSEAVQSVYEKFANETVQVQTEEIAATVVNETYVPLQSAENMLNIQMLSEDEVLAEEFSDETSVVKTVSSEVKQQDVNANAGETAKGEGEQSDFLQNAEVEFNMAVAPTVENKVSANFNPINSETPQAAANREILNQIFDKIKVDIRPGVSEIKMNLKPESLGEVSLRIASENGIITAHFVAESQRVKEIIESNFNQLRDSLSEQGVNISELSVSVSTGNNEQHMSEFLKERSKSQARIANILASLENEEAAEIDEQEIYDNTLNIKV